MTTSAVGTSRRRTSDRLRRVGRAVVAVGVLLVVVVGLPWALVRWGYWPITGVPTWRQITDLPSVVVSDRALFGIVTVAAWVVWVAFVVSVAAEILAIVRGRNVDIPGIRPVQRTVRTLVAWAALSVGTATTSIAAPLLSGAAATTTTVVVDHPASAAPIHQEPPPAAAPDTSGVAEDPEPAWETVVVESGDSAWSLAERHYGTGTRWRQIWADNRQADQPDGQSWADEAQPLEPGWVIRIRGDATAQRPVPRAAGSDAAVGPAGPAPDTVVVQPGDHFWGIARARLTEEWDRPPSDAEIVPYWRQLMDANNDRLAPPGDPDVIFPGQEFVMPPAPAVPAVADMPPSPTTGNSVGQAPDPATPSESSRPPVADKSAGQTPTDTTSPPAPDGDSSDTPTTSEPTGSDGSTPDVSPTAPSRGHETPPSSASTDSPSSAPDVPSREESGGQPSGEGPVGTDSADGEHATPPDAGSGTGGDETGGENSSGVIGVVAGLGVSAGLAAVTVRALARRRSSRRRSLCPGGAPGPRPAEDVETERALTAASGDVVERAWQAARQFGAALGSDPRLPAVMGLVVRPSGSVLVHLADVATPIEPFVAGPASTVWELPANGAGDPVEGEDTVPVLEALVALGRTADDEWLFVDLECLGFLQIVGDGDAATNLARSVLAELTLQPLDHFLHITAVGIGAPEITEQGVVLLDRLDDEVVRRLERLSTEDVEALTAAGFETTAAARVHGVERDGLIPTVVVVGRGSDPVLLNCLAEAAAPGGHGLAVVTLDAVDVSATTVEVAPDGLLQLPHLGMTVHPVGLDLVGLREVDTLLRHEPDTVSPGAGALTIEPQRDAGEPAGYDDPGWDYRVRIFADCRIETSTGAEVSFSYDGNPAATSRNVSRGPELLAYLGLRPDRSATVDELRDHLWWGKEISEHSVANLLSATRKVLGGTAYLSGAEGDPGRRRYRLMLTVRTDVELLDATIAYARAAGEADPINAAAVLRQRLADVRAPAFRSGYLGQGLAEWAIAHRVLDRIEQSVIEAGLLVAELLIDQGPEHLRDALAAVDAALRATPTNEPLIRAAMTLESRLGHRDAALSRYKALATALSRDDLDPDPATADLHEQISVSHPVG